jgi:putative radical SAM enzyme (TIGR03279 family)
MVTIASVEAGSVCDKLGLRAGDSLVAINSHEIYDILDYRFHLCEKKIKLTVVRDGKTKNFRFRKEENDLDIGLEFATALMDEKQSCKNKCIFCFIDQNPPGMRQSCYFKDDDSRLSFLHGNYVTLTNISEREVERIIEMHISPINVSVHTTDPELRCKMLSNRFAGEKLSYLRRFADAGITICAQIVLCRGINDGAHLDRTLHDLMEYLPALDSVSIVPAGLTKYRENLPKLELFSPEECRAVINQVAAYGDYCMQKYGTRVFLCSDEFYVRGGLPLPDEDFYCGFSQLEDGVGMLTSFKADALRELEFAEASERERAVSVVTGHAAYDTISEVARLCEEKHGKLRVNVIRIDNKFFGETVTVAGLLTGGDMIAGCRGKELGETLFIPRNSLRADGDLFLDNLSPEDLERELGVPVKPLEGDGALFVAALCGYEI